MGFDLPIRRFLRKLPVLEERLKETGEELPEDVKQKLNRILSQQENFNKVRNVEKVSINLRFRIITGVRLKGNILDPKKYPEIADNTLNLLLPCHNESEENEIRPKIALVFSVSKLKGLNIFKVKHHFNGYFLVVQTLLE